VSLEALSSITHHNAACCFGLECTER
jgi:hypothetical protein